MFAFCHRNHGALKLLVILPLAYGFLMPAIACGQMETMRFELGRRLSRFERAWESADAQKRADCVEPMEGAVRSFFGLQLDTAAQLLDRATQKVLSGTDTAIPLWLAANRYSVNFEDTWLDSKTRTLRFQLRRIGGGDSMSSTSPHTRGTLRLTILDGDRPMATQDWADAIPLASDGSSEADGSSENDSRADASYVWELPELPAGDYQVTAYCRTSDGEIDLIAEGISISEDREVRMKKVQAWYEENRRGKGDTALSSARWLARELKQGMKGDPTEFDVPWNLWLQDFEALRERKGDFLKSISEGLLSQRSSRSYWLQLSDGEKTQIARLGFPKTFTAPTPVLFAFHGAGGSENMFFETYGAGRLIDLANQRGWLVVSPRQSLNGLGMDIAGMLDELEKWTPIDRTRVMLVGHSMGAAQAVNQVSLHPKQVQAVAALGGGGMPRSALKSNPVPFFVAAGDRDFGRPRAKSLADALRNLNCKVDYRNYADVEHMVIVQAALNDVFAFLDDVAKNPESTPSIK